MKRKFEELLDVDHINITRILQLFESDDKIYMVMEYFEEGDLKAFMLDPDQGCFSQKTN